MSRRPNRGGGKEARALKAERERGNKGGNSGRGGGGGRGSGAPGKRGGAPDDSERDTVPSLMVQQLERDKFTPAMLSSASGIYVGGGPLFAPLANSTATSSSAVSFTSILPPATASSSSSNAPAPVVYRESLHGIPRAVEVSEQQLDSLQRAITQTRLHDLSVQNALLAASQTTDQAPLFGASADQPAPLFSDSSSSAVDPSSSPSSSSALLSLAASTAPTGSLLWLQAQVGAALSHLGFRRRLVKAALAACVTPTAVSNGFASNRELMSQLQDFKRSLNSLQTAPRDHLELIQRATQSSVDWLLLHAQERDLPRAFTAKSGVQVVDTASEAAVQVEMALSDKIHHISDLDLDFSRVDITDAFRQIAGEFADLTSSAKGNLSSTEAIDALDENLALWVLYDWFDLRPPPAQSVLDAAASFSMDEDERREVRENEIIVVESMFPEVEARGRTSESVRIPLNIVHLPPGGFLEVAHPPGNLYPQEPPLFVFTHPTLSVEAKRSSIRALYQEAWNLVGSPMIFDLHGWLTENLFDTLKQLYPDEMQGILREEAASEAERQRKEKENTAEYKKKAAKLSRKEEEKTERAAAERAKVDKEFAAKRVKEQHTANAAVSKRIGAVANVLGKIRAEEEEEEERRRVRIEQMKSILEAEQNPQSTPSPSESPDATQIVAAQASPSDAALDASSASPFAPLFPDIGSSASLEGDAAFSGMEDTLEIQDPSSVRVPPPASEEALFVPAPVDTKLSAKLLQDWNRVKGSKRFQELMVKRATLPAQLMKQQLVDLIMQNQVVVVSGSTGCGKSTQLPQFILDSFIESGQGSSCNIICTQPRRLAAIAVAERVAVERTEKIGDTVGYSIRLESKRSSKTRLLFCTTGVILRHLESSPDLKGVSCVIVDEVHERSIDSDFLLIILKALLQRRPDLKLVLMSATLNAEIFQTYFNGCKAIDIPGRAFPVQSLYLEDIVERTKYQIDARSEYARKDKGKGSKGGDSSSSSSKDLQIKTKGGKAGADDEVASKLAQYKENESREQLLATLKYRDEATGEERSYSKSTLSTLELLDMKKINYELLVELVKYIITAKMNHDGSILIFLSGMQEISTLIKEMKRDDVLGNEKMFALYPLHSLLSSQEQQRVFEIMPSASGRTKIVVSTNIAETSLTIEDVTVVIDSGKMKEMQYSDKNGMSQLVETNVSQANARQRAGRAGRVRPGVCFYLYTSQQSKSLPAQQLPEMLRAPLEQLCLRIKSLNLGSISGFLSRAIEPPSASAIEHVVEVLRQYNALERREEVLTPLGFHLAALPVDARIGKMMIFGCIFRCLDPILTIAASLSVRNPFIVPFEKRDEVDEIRRKFTPYQSDHLTLLAAYNGWVTAKAKSKAEERNYCGKNFLSWQTLTMISDMRKQLAVLLSEIGFLHRGSMSEVLSPNDPVNQHASNIRLVEAVIVAGLYPHIARLESSSVSSSDRPSRPGRPPRAPRPVWKVREGEVSIHPSSVLFNEDSGFDSPFCVYHERVKTGKVYIRDATIVGSYALLLFGVDMVVQQERSLVILDDWLSFQIRPRTAALISDLRLELRKLLVEKIQCPQADMGQHIANSSSSSTSAAESEQSELVEARSEWRRMGPASMLGGASTAAASLTSGLLNLLTPNAALHSAPDLINVVSSLLAEEESGRQKRKAEAAASAKKEAAAAATATTTGVAMAPAK